MHTNYPKQLNRELSLFGSFRMLTVSGERKKNEKRIKEGKVFGENYDLDGEGRGGEKVRIQHKIWIYLPSLSFKYDDTVQEVGYGLPPRWQWSLVLALGIYLGPAFHSEEKHRNKPSQTGLLLWHSFNSLPCFKDCPLKRALWGTQLHLG